MTKKRSNSGGSHVNGANETAKDMSRGELRRQEAARKKAEEAAEKERLDRKSVV